MKKAQGISVDVIIIVAIALLVLVILSVIFIGRLGIFGSKLEDCTGKGGICAPKCGEGAAESYPLKMDWNCPEEQSCCIKIMT